MVKLKTKIKAFTIMESMVAIVIIMIVFGLSSVVIIDISSSGITKEKQYAYTLVQQLRAETFQQSRFIDESFELDNLMIEKTFLDYPESSELKVLLITAYRDKEKLFESKELVLIKTNNL